MDERKTRIVFPNARASAVWSIFGASIMAWAAWISLAIVELKTDIAVIKVGMSDAKLRLPLHEQVPLRPSGMERQLSQRETSGD